MPLPSTPPAGPLSLGQNARQGLGLLAAERTMKRLNPVQLASGKMPILFDPRVGGSLIGALLGAISGPGIARRTSFLLGREDELLFDSSIVIVDDPHRPRGLKSRPFDGEGVATRASRLIDGGRLTGWLLNAASARQRRAFRAMRLSPGKRVQNHHFVLRHERLAEVGDRFAIDEHAHVRPQRIYFVHHPKTNARIARVEVVQQRRHGGAVGFDRAGTRRVRPQYGWNTDFHRQRAKFATSTE